MAHIHELIDWTIVAYVIYGKKALFVFHKELQKWLPLGGHIELNEDPDEALAREVKEESGIEEFEVLSEKPIMNAPERKVLYTPSYMDIHPISNTHKHIGLTYFLKVSTDTVQLADQEHEEIRWLSEDDLDDAGINLDSGIKLYAREAIKRANVESKG
ncbi:MAG: NUDIX domain-containing protein [bacterium]|nr:NUDIX domain-containing protein [bacterium]